MRFRCKPISTDNSGVTTVSSGYSYTEPSPHGTQKTCLILFALNCKASTSLDFSFTLSPMSYCHRSLKHFLCSAMQGLLRNRSKLLLEQYQMPDLELLC